MRVVVTGATGNVGTSLCAALGADPGVDLVLGLSRRRPDGMPEGCDWAFADVCESRLEPLFEGADAVVHLAWLIQPSLKQGVLERVNVEGSRRVFEAAARAGVPTLVHASSVGAYSPRPETAPTDESWPTEGVPSSFYSRHKAAAEALLDRLSEENPRMRVARLRPALIFKREAASEIARYFIGPFVPGAAVRPDAVPVAPWIRGLRFQCVHADDVAEAYRRVVLGDASGPFNVAASPVVDRTIITRLFESRVVEMPRGLARGALDAAFHARVVPTPPGWLDLAMNAPVMDTSRARRELGWAPRRSSTEALAELIQGLREGSGAATPPMVPRSQDRGLRTMSRTAA